MTPYRPTTRVMTVLELLQTHPRISGAELARRLEVDGRTLRRYIVMLEELGIPITTERGRHGGYSLVAGFKLPPMIFNDDEALALSVGLLAARHLGLAEAAPAVAAAQAKLERVMPPKLEQRARAISETVRLDLPQANAPGDNAALTILSTAAQTRKRVHLRYASAEQNHTERDFDPYGLAYQNGCWYAIGHCHLRRDLRSFRLDRVLQVNALETSFKRPAEFDPLAYLSQAVATIPRAHAIEVLLKADMATIQREWSGWLGVLEPVADGVLLRSQAEELGWYARQLARLPYGFEIRHPPELRAVLADWARRLLAMSRADQDD